MILHIFAVRDRATDQFGNPMFLVSRGQAARSFGDEINRKDPENYMGNHPDDFDLYALGMFDSDTGLFETHPPQQFIIGKNVKL